MKVKDLVEKLTKLSPDSEVLVSVTNIQTSPNDHRIDVVGCLEEIATSYKDATVSLCGDGLKNK